MAQALVNIRGGKELGCATQVSARTGSGKGACGAVLASVSTRGGNGDGGATLWQAPEARRDQATHPEY
jgi:hypothetical protein